MGLRGIVIIHVSPAVKHSLKYYITACTGLQDLPEFIVVGMVDDVEVIHCDSTNRIFEPKQDWGRKLYENDTLLFEESRQHCFVTQPYFFQAAINSLKQTNQSKGTVCLCNVYYCTVIKLFFLLRVFCLQTVLLGNLWTFSMKVEKENPIKLKVTFHFVFHFFKKNDPIK